MCRDINRSDVMSEFVRKGEKVFILSDSGKLGKKAVRTFCQAEEIDCIISDEEVSPAYRDFFRSMGTELILA